MAKCTSYLESLQAMLNKAKWTLRALEERMTQQMGCSNWPDAHVLLSILKEVRTFELGRSPINVTFPSVEKPEHLTLEAIESFFAQRQSLLNEVGGIECKIRQVNEVERFFKEQGDPL